MLPPLQATVCSACGRRVYFRLRSTVPSTDGISRVAYLKCPVCGASATQVQEIGEGDFIRKIRTRKRFQYET